MKKIKNKLDRSSSKETSFVLRVLLIEDSESDGELIQLYLSSDKTIAVTWVRTLAEGLSRLHKVDAYDVVLLDLGLQDSEGLPTLSRLLHLDLTIPIVVLTGDTNESVGIQAVRLGANDYLVKGKTNSEFLARAIHFSVERSRAPKRLGSQAQRSESYLLKIGDLQIDFRKQEALHLVGSRQKKISLTPSEFKLLMLLHKNLGSTVTRDQIVSEIWEGVSVRTVDRHVCALKRKLVGAKISVETVHGKGYRLEIQ